MESDKTDTRSRGRAGEELARAYLEQKGLKFVRQNWYCGHLELDLVMEDESFIRFIEVRSLTYPNVIEPFETVNILKQRRVIRAAGAFLRKEGIRKEAVFDVVSVVFFHPGSFKIEYIPDAFTPLW